MPTHLRRLVAVAEQLDEAKTARELSDVLELPRASVFDRLKLLEALGRAMRVGTVRIGRRGPKGLRWRCVDVSPLE